MGLIDSYTTHYYALINKRFRDGEERKEDTQLVEEIKKYHQSRGVVFRGTRNFGKDLKVGDTFENAAPLSCSREKAIAKSYCSSYKKSDVKVFYTIHGNSYDISVDSKNKHEQEEVFLPNTKFDVTDVYSRWGYIFITLVEKGYTRNRLESLINLRVI